VFVAAFTGDEHSEQGEDSQQREDCWEEEERT